jgi:hypothetical protein
MRGRVIAIIVVQQCVLPLLTGTYTALFLFIPTTTDLGLDHDKGRKIIYSLQASGHQYKDSYVLMSWMKVMIVQTMGLRGRLALYNQRDERENVRPC